jgi:transposase
MCPYKDTIAAYAADKASKISIITDEFGVPLNCNIYSCSINDSKILINQLDDIKINNKELLNNNNILLADAGYDSNLIRNKLKDMNLGKLLSHRNKRNIKDKKKLENIKLLPSEKELLKKRIKIEHTNAHLKLYRRLSIRYDKYSSNYMLFLYLACYDIILKNIIK